MRLSPTPCRVCFRPRVFNWSLLTEMRHIDRHTTPLVTLGYSTTHEYSERETRRAACEPLWARTRPHTGAENLPRALLACLYLQASDLLVLPQLVEHIVEVR